MPFRSFRTYRSPLPPIRRSLLRTIVLCAAFAAGAAAALLGCSAPRSYVTSEARFVIDEGASAVIEIPVRIPAEALGDGFSFTRAVLTYTVESSGGAEATGTLYASPDSFADGIRSSGDESLTRIFITPVDSPLVGTVSSDVFTDAVRARRDRFVIGVDGFASGLGPDERITITVHGEIEGSGSSF